MVTDADAESLGHRVGGDVVMGGADAAGGEDEIMAAAQRVQPLDDLVFVVGNDPDFLEIDAQSHQEAGNGVGIGILGAAGEDFVADHQHRGGLHACLGFFHRRSRLS
jgi:hypothetical protein